jgi:hypothetical protein
MEPDNEKSRDEALAAYERGVMILLFILAVAVPALAVWLVAYLFSVKRAPTEADAQQALSRVWNTGCQGLEAEPAGHNRVASVGRATAGGPIAPLDVRLRILFAHIVFRLQARIEVVENKLRLNRVSSESQNQEHPFHCQISFRGSGSLYQGRIGVDWRVPVVRTQKAPASALIR